MKVLALDYGAARTGVAVSDPTGTVARPLEVVERAGTRAGLERLADIVRREGAERVVVGLPLTLRGEVGEQARETEAFLAALRTRVGVPVETYDERLTTRMAQASRREGAGASEDSLAAAHLLEGFLAARGGEG